MRKFILAALFFCVQLCAQEEITLSIIKPDAVAAKHIGDILSRFEKAGFTIADLKMLQLSQEDAEEFYEAHKEKPFYPTLTRYMSSGPIVAIVLKGQNAIAKNRELMGSTDPKKASPGTLRADFGTSVERNAVHGSDSPEAAKREVELLFGHK